MKCLYHIALLLFLLSCGGVNQKEETSFKVYNLDQEFEEMDLSIGDLIEEMELVVLETTNESLLNAQQLSYVIGENYIVTLDPQKILLFGRDGKYIRELGHAGRGPGEYQGLFSYSLDPKEEYLYLANQNNAESLLAYKLSDASFKEVDVPGRVHSFVFLDENTLLGSGTTSEPFRFFEIELTTEKVKSKPQKVPEGRTSASIGFWYKNESEIFHYQKDTIYAYSNFELTPLSTFKMQDKMDPEKLTSGNSLMLPVVNSDFLIANKYYTEITHYDNGGFGFQSLNSQIIYIDRETNKFKVLGNPKFERDAGFNTSFFQRANYRDNTLSIKYEPATWLDIIESENAESLPDNLISASEGLDFEDNPVLLIGKVKPLK